MKVNVTDQAYQDAQHVLEHLGISIEDAIEVYFRQIAYTKGIPFQIGYSNKSYGYLTDVERQILMKKI